MSRKNSLLNESLVTRTIMQRLGDDLFNANRCQASVRIVMSIIDFIAPLDSQWLSVMSSIGDEVIDKIKKLNVHKCNKYGHK
jgi:hypothetical protein